MRVMKFGGSSIASPERVRVVASIILEAAKEEPVVVVVSAFQGVSNQLIACGQMAAAGDPGYQTLFRQLSQRHIEVIHDLVTEKSAAVLIATDQLLIELNEILQGIYLLRELTAGAQDHIAGFGERLSANIIAAHINQQYPAEYVDSRQFIFTDDAHGQANVLFDKTNTAIRQFYDTKLSRNPIIPVTTGFIGQSPTGRTTTLGRNSSDYSATIIGGALDASRVEIWTDVDGIYSADPRYVPSAFIVPQLTFAEAVELSYFGAKVIHPSTFIPVLEKNIPIIIKNTLSPAAEGTSIAHQKPDGQHPAAIAKSITAIDDITLLIWEGNGTIDVSSTIERVFKSLTQAHINILLILEGSPKHTICLAINSSELERAKRAIQIEFSLELQHQLISFEEKPSQSIIAIIGDQMKHLSPVIAGKMFQSLGRAQITTNAIVQGASERNLSLVIDAHKRTQALNLIHQSFFSEYKCLTLLVVGAGRVGSALLNQLKQQISSLHDKKFQITVCAIANSRKMLLDPKGIDLENWESEFKENAKPMEMSELLKLISKIENNNIALVDCTASDATVDAYPMFVQEGVHIITPNKRANVLPYQQWKKLMDKFKQHQCHFLCRTNVGAGLPILTVLEDLLACGDTIYKIEGIVSGTLSYLFNHYDANTGFSDLLKQTQDLAMTEPDPREDLSGIDVARKLLILARKMGWTMDMSDIPVENLVPAALQGGAFQPSFFNDLKVYDDQLKEKLLACQKENKVLRYIGTLEDNKAYARLEALPADHPLALSCFSDNIISFTTQHYREAPLVIRGPGAGVECTALGVFSDILKLLSYLPS